MYTIEIYECLPGDEATVNDLIIRCEAWFAAKCGPYGLRQRKSLVLKLSPATLLALKYTNDGKRDGYSLLDRITHCCPYVAVEPRL